MITGNEPFYPVHIPKETNPFDHVRLGITIRQEAILRFMVELSKKYHPSVAQHCSEEAELFANSYIKIINK